MGTCLCCACVRMHLQTPLHVLCVLVCLHTVGLCVYIPAGLYWIDWARSAWVSSQGKIEAAICGGPRATEDIITPGVSLAKTGATKRSFIKVDPRLWRGGGYQLTCCPAVRSGIKRQVERESIPWLEWGGNKKVCGYLQGSRQTRSNCGRLSLLISLPCFFCNSTGSPAVLLCVCLHAHFT